MRKRDLLSSLFGAVVCCASASQAVPVAQKPKAEAAFDVPRVAGIVVDGQAGDWAARGFRVEVLNSDAPISAADSNGVARIAWDERGLLLLMKVRDDVSTESPESFWEKDSVELFVADERGGKNIYEVAISPGTSIEYSKLRFSLYDGRVGSFKDTPLKAEVARVANADGYTLEALLPWSNLGIAPARGRALALQINLNDVDDASAKTQLRWFPIEGAWDNISLLMPLRLATKPSAPFRASGVGQIEKFRRVKLQLVGDASLAGQKISVRDGDRVLDVSQFSGANNDGVRAEVSIPMPPRGRKYNALRLIAGNRQVGTLYPPDIEAQRREVARVTPLLFQPAVFEGESFPFADFDQPSLMEDVLGPYKIETTFYDADYKLVTKAEKPGRYGAVSRVRLQDGTLLKRYVTLYRQPKTLNWSRDMNFNIELPEEFGIGADVTREQSRAVNRYLKWNLQGSFRRDDEAGQLMAGLAESGEIATRHRGVYLRDQLWWYGLKKQIGEAQPLRYLLDLPDGYSSENSKRWPLVLFLHGAGEAGDDLRKVRAHGPPSQFAQGRRFPFILVSPQLPVDEEWVPTQLNELLDDIAQKYRVDASRIYVTGLSRGGLGTWNMAMETPERFAAIAPIAIWGNPLGAERIKNLPTWYFVGGKDTAVPVAQTLKMDEAMKGVSNVYKFTLYSEADHATTWIKAYDDPLFYEWLLSHKRR